METVRFRSVMPDSYEWVPIPRIMGHEYPGTVIEMGSSVTAFEEGDVVEEPIHDCGSCFQCKNGQLNVCQNFSITSMPFPSASRCGTPR